MPRGRKNKVEVAPVEVAPVEVPAEPVAEKKPRTRKPKVDNEEPAGKIPPAEFQYFQVDQESCNTARPRVKTQLSSRIQPEVTDPGSNHEFLLRFQ